MMIIVIDADINDHQYNNNRRCRCCSVAPKCWLVGLRLQLTQHFTVTSQPQIAKQNSRQIFKYLSRWVVQCRIVCNQSEILLKIRADHCNGSKYSQRLCWTFSTFQLFNCSTFQLFNCAAVQLCNCSAVQLFNCAAVQVFDYAAVQACNINKCIQSFH